MRKTLLSLVTAAIILSLGTTCALAAGPGCGGFFADADGDGICDNAYSRCAYVDADGDSVCDLCGTDHSSCVTGECAAFLDEDGDGLCDLCETYHWCDMTNVGCGSRFADEDGDGVCDYYALGQGGENFVDSDGDGVCDNYASGQGQGRGCGYGRGARRGCGNGFRRGRGR